MVETKYRRDLAKILKIIEIFNSKKIIPLQLEKMLEAQVHPTHNRSCQMNLNKFY